MKEMSVQFCNAFTPVSSCAHKCIYSVCVCVCVLTVMKGLEFVAGGEFVITLIPLERYSPA